jgi:NADH-quinone oxidoreductase subunit N
MNEFTRPSVDWYAIAPVIAVFGAGVLIVALAALTPRARGLARAHLWVALAGILTAGGFTFPMWHRYTKSDGGVEQTIAHAMTVDGFAIFLHVTVLAAAFCAVLISWAYLGRERLEKPEYLALMLFSTSGMLIMTTANDLVVIFVALEILSIALYVLAGFQRAQAGSQEAALKYFILGAFSSAIFLYGVALVYGATGTTLINGGSNPQRLGIVQSIAAGSADGKLVLVGIVLVMVGLGFKVAAVPFHTWSPDVYQGAPPPVTGFMAAATKAAAFAATVRVFVLGFGGREHDWRPALWLLAVLTLVIGAAVGLRQNDVKRMMAYSSINHAGYILIGVQAATDKGVASVCTYLFTYTFLVLGSFAVLTVLTRPGDAGFDLGDLRGLAGRQPVLAGLFTLFLLGQAGIPLTSGFVAKLQVFSAAVDRHVYSLAIVGVLASVVSTFIYLRIVVAMYAGGDDHAHAADHGTEGTGGVAVAVATTPRVRVDVATAVVLFVCAGVTLFVGFLPGELLDFADRSLLGR